MWSVLKAAFWHRERLPLLGSVPVNALALAAFAALGFGHPLFWWAGIGLEAAWLFLCATSPRYRRVALLPQRESLENRAAEQQQTIFLQLNPALRQRHEALRARIRKIAGLWDESGGPTTEGTGLDQLEWLHLKFLVGKQHLEAARDEAPEAAIADRLAALKAQLARPGTDAASRGPLESTIRIVEERLATSAERSRRLEEIDASLHHIEQQLELTLEKALLRTGVAGQTHTIDLASHTLDTSADLFGSTLPAVSDLDQWHSASAAAGRALSA